MIDYPKKNIQTTTASSVHLAPSLPPIDKTDALSDQPSKQTNKRGLRGQGHHRTGSAVTDFCGVFATFL